MKKAAPLPVFGPIAQTLLDRIAMDVTEFFRELAAIANVEVIIALLPEMLAIANQTA
jgi:hypothetical protein